MLSNEPLLGGQYSIEAVMFCFISYGLSSVPKVYNANVEVFLVTWSKRALRQEANTILTAFVYLTKTDFSVAYCTKCFMLLDKP